MLSLHYNQDPFYQWRAVIQGIGEPYTVKNWRTDEGFAMQRLTGLNPGFIHKPKQVPPNVAVLLPKGVDIDQVYVCDFEMIKNCVLPPGSFLQAPVGYFYVNSADIIMPLAIQFDRESEFPHLFTPNDPPGIWLSAKIHFQTAEANYHIFSHYAETHAIMEAVYVSLRRNVSNRHPLSSFLKPHFWYTIHIGDNARKKLICEEGILQKLTAAGFSGQNTFLEAFLSQWSFEKLHYPKQVVDKQIQNIPHYYWRDDSMELWKIIERYVNEIVNLIYLSDEEVEKDSELAAWMAELTQQKSGCNFKGIRGLNEQRTFQSRDDLAFFLHCIIFNITVTHSSTNNAFYDHLGFVPNMPVNFKMNPLRLLAQGDILENEIVDALPKVNYEGLIQIAIAHSLSIKTQRSIGNYEADFLFGIQGTQKLIMNFRQNLKELSRRIKFRNQHLGPLSKAAYKYLDPDIIAQSIEL